ncbi:hypothetical protein ABZ366_33615, partial [Streptomyces sp. NPDC005904]|uniref:hypothetical protein n=1 Tax=Streptomyces sp. NPDC005904 TaxID=3154570 RepID=UPI0033CCCEC7
MSLIPGAPPYRAAPAAGRGRENSGFGASVPVLGPALLARGHPGPDLAVGPRQEHRHTGPAEVP